MRTRTLPCVVALAVGLLMMGAATPAGAKSKPISAANLKALTKSINNAKHLTYEATYQSVSPGAPSVTVTIAQAPPKSNFTTTGGSVINDGKKTYYCSDQGGQQSCISAGGSNPLVGLEGLFGPTAAITAFAEAKSGLASRGLGVKVVNSTQKFAGQASTCISVTVKGNGGKYCVTKQGLLSYSGTATSHFELTKYVKSPPSSLFSLPAGATTVTLPGGATIP